MIIFVSRSLVCLFECVCCASSNSAVFVRCFSVADCWLLTVQTMVICSGFGYFFPFCVLYLRSAKRPNHLNKTLLLFFSSSFGLILFLHLIFHMIIQWGTVDRVTVAPSTKYLNRYAYFFVSHSDDHFSHRVFYGNVHYNKILFVCFVFVRFSLASDSTHKCNYKYI